MAELHLICGLPGSGKSTLARRLEHELPALRLTPDEWMARIVGDGHDEARREAVELVQLEIAARVLSLGVNVVLESGFWSRRERDEFREKAHDLGARTKLHFLDVSREELKRRIVTRNESLPADTFAINADQLDEWWALFERPGPDELDGSTRLPSTLMGSNGPKIDAELT